MNEDSAHNLSDRKLAHVRARHERCERTFRARPDHPLFGMQDFCLCHSDRGYLLAHLARLEAEIAQSETERAEADEALDAWDRVLFDCKEGQYPLRADIDRVRHALASRQRVTDLYHELLYEVCNKVPDESRHETVRRIIRQWTHWRT